MIGSGGLRKRTRPGTFIPRALLRDGRLSFKARGLQAHLLDRPLGWDVRAEMLAAEGPDGKAAIHTALQELRTAGYYRLERRQGPDGRFSMGTAISEEPVAEWVKDNEEYDGKAVPVVWHDGQWQVRHLDGSLTADGFEGYDDGNLTPDTPDRDNEPESSAGSASSQVTPEAGFPSPDNPAPVKPASGSPGSGSPDSGEPGAIRRTEEGVNEKNFRDEPASQSHHGGASGSIAATATKPRARTERSEAEQALFDAADSIARTWWDSWVKPAPAGKGVSIVGNRFPGFRKSIVLAALQAGADAEHVKRALIACGDPFPPIVKFQRELTAAQTGQQAGAGKRPGRPGNAWHDPGQTDEERGRLDDLFSGVSIDGEVINDDR